MFDRDVHHKYADAIKMANDNGFRLAISNPCLELWFLLHFHDQTAWIHRDDVQQQRVCRSHLSNRKTVCHNDLTDLSKHHGKATETNLRTGQ